MIDEEKIYQAISEVCNTDNPQRFAKMNKTVFEVAKKALELSEPSLPSNLDEAAEEYAYRGIPDIMKPTFKPLADEVVKFFKSGAEWMANRNK